MTRSWRASLGIEAKSRRGQVRSHHRICKSAPGRDLFWGRAPELARHLGDRGEKPGPLPPSHLWERTWARHLLRPWPGAGAAGSAPGIALG